MCPRSLDEGLVWTDADGRTFQRWEVYESVKAERDRLRDQLRLAREALAYVLAAAPLSPGVRSVGEAGLRHTEDQ